MRKVLITGISGGQGRLLAKRLSERYEVCGVDRMPWEGAPRNIRVHTLDLRKKRFRNILRTEQPDAVVHLAFVRHFRSPSAVRHEVKVNGTRRLLEQCAESDIDRVAEALSAGTALSAGGIPLHLREGFTSFIEKDASKAAE